jgi:hypothetical protein
MPDTQAIELPVNSVVNGVRAANFRVGTTIGGSPYIIDGRWDTRDAAWYLDFLEADLTPIIFGIKLVLGAYLGRTSNHHLFRDGVLVAVDSSGQRKDAGFDDMGTRVLLEYIPVLELLRRLKVTSDAKAVGDL